MAALHQLLQIFVHNVMVQNTASVSRSESLKSLRIAALTSGSSFIWSFSFLCVTIYKCSARQACYVGESLQLWAFLSFSFPLLLSILTRILSRRECVPSFSSFSRICYNRRFSITILSAVNISINLFHTCSGFCLFFLCCVSLFFHCFYRLLILNIFSTS